MLDIYKVSVGKVVTITGTFTVRATSQEAADAEAVDNLETADIIWDKNTECDSKAEILNVEIETAQSQPQGHHTSGGA